MTDPTPEQQLDGAYRERAHLVALLAALYPAHIGYTDPNAVDWLVVTIETPTGQMSWHIAERDRDLFEHVRLVPAVHNVWDGHSTEEKYARLRRLTASPGRAEAAIARVRKACDSVKAADQGHNPAVGWVVTRVLEAIDARLVNGAAPASSVPAAAKTRACRYCPDPRCPENCPECGSPIHDLDSVPPAAGLAATQATEHCGHLSPETLLTSPRTECVLPPGHSGSHADDRGCRWWPIPDTTDAERIDTAHRYCILCGNQVQPGHTCDPAGLRRVYGSLADRAENARERLHLAREALIRDGYFTADEVGDDIAPRITELSAARLEVAQKVIRERDAAEQRAEQLAATLREVLDAFTTARRDDGVIAGHFLEGAIHPDDFDRWRTALEPAKEQH